MPEGPAFFQVSSHVTTVKWGGTRFGSGITEWLARATEWVPTHGFSNLAVPVATIDEYAETLRDPVSAEVLRGFALLADYGCLELDGRMAGSAQAVSGARSSEGRYAIVRSWIERGLSCIPDSALSNLIADLLHCADEGIRWAVVANVGTLIPRLNDKEAAAKLLTALVDDVHPWVVRETIQRLASLHGMGVSVREPLELVLRCAASIDRFVEQGWEQKEFMKGFLQLVACYPELVQRIDIRSR